MLTANQKKMLDHASPANNRTGLGTIIYNQAAEGWFKHEAQLPSVTSNQSDIKVRSWLARHAWTVKAVDVYARAVTATATVTVKENTTAILSGAITPVAGSIVSGTISDASIAQGNTLNVHVTTDGSGALTDAMVTIYYLPTSLA